MRKFISSLLVTFAMLTSTVAVSAETKGQQDVLIHLSSYTDNLHSVGMALKIGHMLSKNDISVILFLDLEGVRLVDKSQPQNLVWGSGDSIEKLYIAYIKAGGSVLVCPHCAEAAGVVDLREGAVIASPDSLLMAIKNADKILDY